MAFIRTLYENETKTVYIIHIVLMAPPLGPLPQTKRKEKFKRQSNQFNRKIIKFVERIRRREKVSGFEVRFFFFFYFVLVRNKRMVSHNMKKGGNGKSIPNQPICLANQNELRLSFDDNKYIADRKNTLALVLEMILFLFWRISK